MPASNFDAADGKTVISPRYTFNPYAAYFIDALSGEPSGFSTIIRGGFFTESASVRK